MKLPQLKSSPELEIHIDEILFRHLVIPRPPGFWTVLTVNMLLLVGTALSVVSALAHFLAEKSERFIPFVFFLAFLW